MGGPAREVERVTTLELFFDLVFVFTITQLTAVLYHAPTLRSLVQVVLMLGVIWWMYGGYAWMTNTVPAATPRRRLLLLGGMAGFFVLALSIPRAFESSGLAFGLAYLLVVFVHSTLFMRASAAAVVRAILRLTPWNVTSALLVVAGGALGGAAQYALWAGAFLLEWLTPVIRGNAGFDIGAAHFVERHGLVIIIAIGESVVAVGIASAHLAVDGALVATALLGLALSACLWWAYFSAGEERAETALAALDPVRRARAGLRGFDYWHIPMLLGIVTIGAHLAVGGAARALGVVSPPTLGGTATVPHLRADDVDALWERAVSAGAQIRQPLADALWGERYGQVVDPFGHPWGLARHQRDAPPEEVAAAVREMFGG